MWHLNLKGCQGSKHGQPCHLPRVVNISKEARKIHFKASLVCQVVPPPSFPFPTTPWKLHRYPLSGFHNFFASTPHTLLSSTSNDVEIL